MTRIRIRFIRSSRQRGTRRRRRQRQNIKILEKPLHDYVTIRLECDSRVIENKEHKSNDLIVFSILVQYTKKLVTTIYCSAHSLRLGTRCSSVMHFPSLCSSHSSFFAIILNVEIEYFPTEIEFIVTVACITAFFSLRYIEHSFCCRCCCLWYS